MTGPGALYALYQPNRAFPTSVFLELQAALLINRRSLRPSSGSIMLQVDKLLVPFVIGPQPLQSLFRSAHARDAASPSSHRFSAHSPRYSGDLASELRLSLQPNLCALPCECRSDAARNDGRRDLRSRDARSERAALRQV